MEENSENQNKQAEEVAKVGFPGTRKTKNSKNIYIIFGVVLLFIVAVIVYYFFRGGEKNYSIQGNLTPTISEVLTETPVPTAASKNKSNLSVSILNGTGISGEAAYLKAKLTSLGYKNIEVDNADNTNYVTTEIFVADSVAISERDELETALQKIYQKVELQEVSSPTSDIRIIIGYRKGVSPTITPTGVSKSVTNSPTPTY